ncbi:peptidoglycan L-alanyl-D-glutamate endopeptidase CwlK [Halobacillus karajensis]|uniref:D-alanyl-D-alanine carboxypeptidase family protein n=1 Tax=Halobacillus karajensis TaxID=195088 RepID=UPI0008A7EC67|nr:D-alanyl-D-alanine carboxypeptidase family protein [Halobacillus karajensis]SEH44797.1 peptidoglycan L-alanyl-D-glutamate endopeptidase CwlK [Halobacillus karajensis]
MISGQTLKDRSERNMGKVQPVVKEKVFELIERAYERGIFAQISSGHRTWEEQAHLYGKGRPDYYWKGKRYGHSGSIVTYAPPGKAIIIVGGRSTFSLSARMEKMPYGQ